MSGSIGPTVTLHTPSAPFVSAGSVDRHSQNTVTFEALGARTRKVTRPSADTSGERTARLSRLLCLDDRGQQQQQEQRAKLHENLLKE